MSKRIRPTRQIQKVLGGFLAEPTEAQYGFDLCRKAGLPVGSIYEVLARLETARWVESSWEAVDPKLEGRPRRRLYRLTLLGEREARSLLREALRELQVAMDGGMA